MDQDTRQLITRGVEALERLSEEPSYEIPTSPPVCPNCGEINPLIIVMDDLEGGAGRMADFIIEAQCQNCNQKFLAIPQGWASFTSMDELKTQVELERAENGSGTDSRVN